LIFNHEVTTSKEQEGHASLLCRTRVCVALGAVAIQGFGQESAERIRQKYSPLSSCLASPFDALVGLPAYHLAARKKVTRQDRTHHQLRWEAFHLLYASHRIYAFPNRCRFWKSCITRISLRYSGSTATIQGTTSWCSSLCAGANFSTTLETRWDQVFPLFPGASFVSNDQAFPSFPRRSGAFDCGRARHCYVCRQSPVVTMTTCNRLCQRYTPDHNLSPQERFTEADARGVCRTLVDATSYLHGEGIVSSLPDL